MKTFIFIRANVDGRWKNYDIGDPKLPDAVVASWIHTKSDGDPRFLRRLVMLLLGRDIEAIS